MLFSIYYFFNKKFRREYFSVIDNLQCNRFRVFGPEDYVIAGFKTNLSSKS